MATATKYNSNNNNNYPVSNKTYFHLKLWQSKMKKKEKKIIDNKQPTAKKRNATQCKCFKINCARITNIYRQQKVTRNYNKNETQMS